MALPAEHGGWSFWLEPVLLGLLVAPSVAGLWMALASLAIFLIRHPFMILWSDYRRGRRYQRTRLALRFACCYGIVALLGMILALHTASASHILIPLLAVVPLVLMQIGFDMRHRSRHWLPESIGPVILSAVASSIALAGGWQIAPALALAFIISSRAVPAVFYVRARLRLEKGQPVNRALPILLHGLALMLIAALAALQLAPALSILAAFILLARAWHGLSRFRRPALPKHIGIQEIVFGLLAVTMAAVGYRL